MTATGRSQGRRPARGQHPTKISFGHAELSPSLLRAPVQSDRSGARAHAGHPEHDHGRRHRRRIRGGAVACSRSASCSPAPFTATVFVFTDMLDGQLARIKGSSGKYGAFLDSTMDRFGDAAIFGGITIWFMRTDHLLAVVSLFCLAGGLSVSYVKARAEGLGLNADVGLIERPERHDHRPDQHRPVRPRHPVRAADRHVGARRGHRAHPRPADARRLPGRQGQDGSPARAPAHSRPPAPPRSAAPARPRRIDPAPAQPRGRPDGNLAGPPGQRGVRRGLEPGVPPARVDGARAVRVRRRHRLAQAGARGAGPRGQPGQSARTSAADSRRRARSTARSCGRCRARSCAPTRAITWRPSGCRSSRTSGSCPGCTSTWSSSTSPWST